MTNIRLTTSMYEDIKYCPFCGEILIIANTNVKKCGYHIRVYKGNPEEEDKLE